MKPKKKNTLEKFIGDNKNLLTILGVFVAVTTFTTELPIKSVGSALTFIFLALTIIIWLEIWEQFPSRDNTWKLIIFENLLSFAMFGLVFYWLLNYRNVWRYVMPFFIAQILILIISAIFKKYNVFNRLFHTKHNERKILRHMLGLIILITIMCISFGIGEYIAPHVNDFLDKTYLKFQEKNES